MQRNTAVLLLLLMATACDDAAEETVQEAPVATTAPEEARVEASPEETPTEREIDIGYVRPFMPSDAQRTAVRAGLEAHSEGDYETSRARFAALVEEAPDYHAARFDLACALARLERVDEAATHLLAVLHADLPTYLSKSREDEDLNALRPRVEEAAPRILERYREAARPDDELVAYRREGAYHWAQAGYWTGERFIPASPRTSARQRRDEDAIDRDPLVAAAVSADGARAVTVSSRFDGAEGGVMPVHRVLLTETFTGVKLAERSFPRMYRDAFAADFGFGGEGGWIRYHDGIEEGQYTVVRLAEGTHNANMEARLHVGQSSWVALRSRGEQASVRGRRLTLGENTVELAGRYDRHLRYEVGTRTFVLSSNYGDCGYPDKYLLSLFDADGELLWSEEKQEDQALVEVRGERILIQNRSGLRVFEEMGSDEPDTLPPGVGLSSGFQATNPYC